MKRPFLVGASVLAVWLVQTAALACPLCSEALFAPGEAARQASVLQGYVVSIAALLWAPLVMLGLVAAVLVRSARRSKRP